MIARLAGFAAALILGGAPFVAAETKNIDRTVPLSAAGTVTLEAHNGSIVVRTWDRPEVEIHVRITSLGRHPWPVTASARARWTSTAPPITFL